VVRLNMELFCRMGCLDKVFCSSDFRCPLYGILVPHARASRSSTKRAIIDVAPAICLPVFWGARVYRLSQTHPPGRMNAAP
jgi:hypothetical protein